MKNILIIDDDLDLCRLLSDYLEAGGYRCRCVHDGEAGLEALRAAGADCDLAILDVMLPRKDGFEVLRELRREGPGVPVIMLTARGETVDLIVGLEMGADDYLPKPFNPRELLARIHSVLRRVSGGEDAGAGPESGRLRRDGFELDENSFQAAFQGRSLNLTPVEFKILWLLMNQAGRVVPRDLLFREALGRRENFLDRSLDMHVSRLRKKIGPFVDGSERLKSIRGEGYLYVPARRERP